MDIFNEQTKPWKLEFHESVKDEQLVDWFYIRHDIDSVLRQYISEAKMSHNNDSLNLPWLYLESGSPWLQTYVRNAPALSWVE